MPYRVFISSTSLDLKKYRQVAIQTCRTLGYEPIVMETFSAMGVGATEGSKRKLREADLYVGIIAHRYGYIEAGYDRSVTEIEFDYAGERGLERLCFVVDPAHPWPKTHIDRKHAAQLQAFKARIDRSVIRSLFTTPADFQQKLVQALVEWQEWRTARSGELDAILATTPDDVPARPPALIGREALLAELDSLLDKGRRVLLQGFGGMGKTALAAAVAARRIEAGKGAVVWLRAGSEDRDGLLDALARAFDAQAAVAKETSVPNKARVVRLLLLERRVHLVVLDDVWNGRALAQLLNVNAIPSGLPVLVTSRQRFTGLTRLDVGRLSRPAALALLCHQGDPGWAEDPQADALCQQLGDHAYAVRLAGLTLALDGLRPAALLERISAAPYKLAAPEGAEDEGRASVEDLLHTSLRTLDTEAREVFLSFGAFFTTNLTPEMLALYLRRDLAAVEDALTRLQRRGLAERDADAQERAAEYTIHDLAYSYAKARASDEQRHRALDACLAYVERYKEPNPANFARLRSELDNVVGAANWAMMVERYADVQRFADWLYRGFDGDTSEGFLHLQGYASVATTLLAQAAQAAHRLGQPARQAVYLGHLGSAYRDLGQVRQGMRYYRQALRLVRALGDKAGEGLALGRLGIAYRLTGQATTAIAYLEQALAIARALDDPRAEGMNLANLGIVHRQLGHIDEAVAYLEQALAIARARHDSRGEAINLGNLGDAYREQRQIERAIAYYQQALALCQSLGDRRGSGINLGRLGDTYRHQGQLELAVQHLEQALAIARETGDKRGQAINLGRLGDACRDRRALAEAISYHEQALAITRQMDDRRGEGYSLLDLGRDHHLYGQLARAATYYREARALFEALGLRTQVAQLDQWLEELPA